MRIAYIVSAHKLPQQLIRLVKRLHTERASFFIHVDKKTSTPVLEQMKQGLVGLSNVFFVKRHSSFWGEPSLLNASLEGLRALFASGVEFDRVMLLSGQDYPLVSNHEIESFLEAAEGEQFIDWHDSRHAPPDAGWLQSGSARVENWHFRIWRMNFVVPGRLEWNTINRYCRSRYRWLPVASALWSGIMAFLPVKRKFPQGLEPYFYGSPYCCLTRACATYIHGLLASDHPFFRFFQYVDMADEMFYQSIVMSSPFKPTVVNDNRFCIDWKNPNPLVPRTFVSSDFDRLVVSGKLFARKFDVNRDAAILDRLDQHALSNKESDGAPTENAFQVPLIRVSRDDACVNDLLSQGASGHSFSPATLQTQEIRTPVPAAPRM